MSSTYKITFTNSTTLKYTFLISEVSTSSSPSSTPTSPPEVTSITLTPSEPYDFLALIPDGTLPSFFVRATATICTKEGNLPLTYQTVVDFSSINADTAMEKGKYAIVELHRKPTPIAPHSIVNAGWNVKFETIEDDELEARIDESASSQN